jgi:hypothetical protein
MLIDQTRDLSCIQLYKLVKDRPDVESYIKEASFSEEEFSALPDSAFAWPEKRAFPIHSKEHAIISRVYRSKCAGVPDYVDVMLKQACEMYDVPESIFAEASVKVASVSEDDYLLPEQRKIRVKTAEDARKAQSTLLKTAARMSPVLKAKCATRLLEKAAKLGVTLDEKIHAMAGHTTSKTATLIDWVNARAAAALEAPHKQAYEKLAENLRTQPAELRDRDGLVKVAEAIHELDKTAGLTKHYGKRLLDPMDTVFNTTTKIAARTVDLNGRRVTVDKLAAYSSEFYGDILGDDLVREASHNGSLDFDKLATIIDTLPRDLKDILARQMRV